MPRLSRKYVLAPGLAFHKIWRAHNRQALLLEKGEKEAYIREIAEDYENHCKPEEFELNAFCVMGNHVHEEGTLGEGIDAFSNHMRRAHGRFGLRFNKRQGRIGKVAHDRPKTLVVQDDDAAMRCQFYIHANPVRAGLIKTPSDLRWRTFSSCRLYTHGERNASNRHLKKPEWYLRLGRTEAARQAAYRSLLDRYLRDRGLIRDQLMTKGHFIGGEMWVRAKRGELYALVRMRANSHSIPP